MTAQNALPDRSVERDELWHSAQEIVCDVSVEIPLLSFNVRGLLELAAGCVLPASWNQTDDVPLRVNGVLIAWAEFEVVGEKLGVRLTELA